MDRRKFLRTAGAFSVPAFLGTTGLGAAPAALLEAIASANNEDRVLVLIQLLGGNDGLNTVVPISQYAELLEVRPNIILPEVSLLGLDTENALHPGMGGMANLYTDNKLGIVQSVGYPNQNRSHFRSTDIWTSASAADEEDPTGWLGRHLDLEHPDFPDGYPNATNPDPLAMVMGNVVTATCQGQMANYSLAVRNPFNFTYIAPGGDTPIPSNNYGDELAFVRQTIAQSNEYGQVVMDAANAGSSFATYPDINLGEQLQNIAYLMSGGLQTRIYVATLGGFDTHANQTNGDTTTGRHAELLATLSDCITAFQDDLEQLGLADRVMGMTFSEFGRQVRSNGSTGTDHGNAAPLFLFGNCVQGGILGNAPTIDTSVNNNEGVDFQYDFRDVYGSVLVDWFNLPASTVQDIIHPAFQYLPIIGGCAALPVEWLSVSATGLRDHIQVSWQTAAEANNRGFEVERSTDGRNFSSIGYVPGRGTTESVSTYEFIDRGVSRGPLYYYRLRQIDVDGQTDLSAIRTARLEGAAIADWQVGLPSPNPIRQDSIVQVYAPVDSMADYELFNQNGQRLKTGRYNLIGGRDNRLSLGDFADLPAGLYHWRLSAGGQQYSRKIVKR